MKKDKENYDFMKTNGLQRKTEEERIKELVDRLISVLYSPSEQDSESDTMFHVDHEKIVKLGIDNTEPINWGGLGCAVEKKDDYFLVTIDEAAPNSCPTLCRYVEKHLKSWGWDVVVETEW